MPPFKGWYTGNVNIGELIDIRCPGGVHDMPMIRTDANGQPAFGLYMRTKDGDFEPFHMQVLELDGDQVKPRRGVLRHHDVRQVRPARAPAGRLRGHGSPVTTALTGAVELLERSLGYTRVILAGVPGADLDRRTPCRDWTLGQLLAHMDDGLDAFTEAAGGAVAVPARGWSPLRVERLQEKACALLGAWSGRRPDGVDVGGARDTERPAGPDRRPRDHRPRVGRRPGARVRPRGSPRSWPRGCCRSPTRWSTTLDRGIRFSPPHTLLALAPADQRLLAFLGRA